MKINSWILALTSLLTISFSACKKDININDDYKDITIVYGLLDTKDSLSYIRVEKAFLSQGNIYSDAQIADSNQYSNKLDVRLTDINGTQIVFDTTTVYNKEGGIFYKDKMKVYVANTQGKLQPKQTYTLQVHNPETGNTQKAKCQLLDASNFLYEGYYPGPAVNFTDNSDLRFKTVVDVNAYQLLIRFHYIDSLSTDHSLSNQHVDMWLSPLLLNESYAGSPQSIGINGKRWFDYIESQIPVKENVFRFEGKIEFFMYMADINFKTYIDVHQNQSSLVIDRPVFTNIENGYGLLAARTYYKSVHRLGNRSVVKLQEDYPELNFVRRDHVK